MRILDAIDMLLYRSRSGPALLVAGALCAGITGTDDARADPSVGVGMFAQGGVADLDGEMLGAAFGERMPRALEGFEVELTSDGRMAGGGLQTLVVADRFRFGVEGAAYRLLAVSSSTMADLPEGMSAELGAPWGVRGSLFAGGEILQGPVYPYVDLRVSLASVFATLSSSSDTHGDLGTRTLASIDGAFGPRLGVLVPMAAWAALDVSAYYPMFGGHERLTFNAGLSLWCNHRDDEHAREMRSAR
jgi:hypothetical protein